MLLRFCNGIIKYMDEIKISKVYNKINYKIYYGDHSCK